ncbi:MAG: c-type cytochrome [Acidobacteria bacterium]|nr:MAG: c-type cytochrome [Acidobacteriota bacterium]
MTSKFLMVMLVVVVAVKSQSPASVKDGVYTKAQAERGQKVFEQSCKACHALEPKGKVTSDAPGPDLAGDEFLTHMNGKPAWALAKVIKDTMPNDFSMEVTEPIALDLAAYILQANKFPEGAAELTAESAKTAIIVK